MGYIGFYHTSGKFSGVIQGYDNINASPAIMSSPQAMANAVAKRCQKINISRQVRDLVSAAISRQDREAKAIFSPLPLPTLGRLSRAQEIFQFEVLTMLLHQSTTSGSGVCCYLGPSSTFHTARLSAAVEDPEHRNVGGRS